MLGTGGAFMVDLFGDLTRCQSVYFVVNTGGGAFRYNNRPPVNGTCTYDHIPIAAVESDLGSFIWHTLRLEARDDILTAYLDGTRVSVIRNPLPSTFAASGLVSVPEGAVPPVQFDDVVVNAISPRDDRDLVWLRGEVYCLQDFSTGQSGLALEAALLGDYVDSIWMLGPQEVGQQSFMLYPDGACATTAAAFSGRLSPTARCAPDVQSDPAARRHRSHGRRFSVPHRGAYPLTDGPRAIQAALDERGIQLSWDAVPPVEGGFNPGGAYLIRVVDANLPASMRLFGPLYEDRGASSVPRYQIPWGRLFRPPTATGVALDELPDGQYQIEVWAVTTRLPAGTSAGDLFRRDDQMTSPARS
jgi:hypothetical protein